MKGGLDLGDGYWPYWVCVDGFWVIGFGLLK